ncbi:MAG: CRISPR-associated endonuclease Cas1 [Calditrichaeota bacterium]|nr:MAG: CRISPR-associated endonuclease Cas1 [Calditrichota bacterium]
MTTLYVREYGTGVGLNDGRIQVRRKGKILQEIPALQLKRIVMMVPASITQQALHFMMDRGIEIAYLSQNGNYYGAFTRGDGNHVLYRMAQFKKHGDTRFRLQLSKRFIEGKIANMLLIWKRQKRHNNNGKQLKQLHEIQQRLQSAKTLDILRGHEGAASVIHFHLLRTALQGDWYFKQRIRRPPPDPVNAMLSLGYTLLYSRMSSTIQLHGLDPYLGFFHEIKRGHAALASDMIEEWRVPAVDALVLRLVNTHQLKPADFRKDKKGYTMSKPALEKFATAFEARLQKLGSTPNESTDPVAGMAGQVRQLQRVLLNKQKKYTAISG